MTMSDWILFLIVAAVCATTASAIVPGKLPGGFPAAMAVGLLGAWIGVSLTTPIQLPLPGDAILPAILGSALLSLGFAIWSKKVRS